MALMIWSALEVSGRETVWWMKMTIFDVQLLPFLYKDFIAWIVVKFGAKVPCIVT